MSKCNSSLGILKIAEIMSKPIPRVHFVGVGGVGMYSLFRLCEHRGILCSGSDAKNGELCDALRSSGGNIVIGHRAENAVGADILVYSLAVSNNNPELLYAAECGIPAVSRAEFLAYLLSGYGLKVAVSGSHGKSSVVAMLDSVFELAGHSPTTISGAKLVEGLEPYRIGTGDTAIYEACEYKDSFLCMPADIAVFTNLELDHTDYFCDLDSIMRSFAAAMDRAQISVVNRDDETLSCLFEKRKCKCVSYGIKKECDFSAVNIKASNGKYSFDFCEKGVPVSNISLSAAGYHMVYNALAAISTARVFGIDARTAAQAISNYRGIERRFEIIGENSGAPVIYDYAHHPTEIRAVLESAREIYKGNINVIFKAHTYSRTKALWGDFVDSLSDADRVFLLSIDGIREDKIEGINAENLARDIGDRAIYLDEQGLISRLPDISGAVLILGAADMPAVKNYYMNKIEKNY